jgi:DNA polymerase-3 subunit delta'
VSAAPKTVLDRVLAQVTAIGTLQRALASNRVHHAYVFDGPPGVGKELAAFGLAQALVCEIKRPACGECGACQRAILREGEKRPRHPDVIVVERGLYDPATIGRRSPELVDISIDQIRTLVLARSAYPPHEGRAKVIIIRRAEELSTSAANALLKTLEEPIASTHFILLTDMLDALLPTVQSRTQRVRFGPLPDDVLLRILAEKKIAPELAKSVLPIANGSVEIALAACDPDENEQRETFVRAAENAIASKDFGAALELAEEAKKDKSLLAPRIRAFAAHLALVGRGADAKASTAASRRFAFAMEALRELEQNASAQLVVESMISRMRSV